MTNYRSSWRSGHARRRVAIGVMALGALLSGATPPLAAEPDSETGADVLTRARPEYDARGLHVGTFFIYPSATAGVGYTDNVFNSSATLDDYFTSIGPQLKVQSDWARHSLTFLAESKSYWYGDQSGENRTDWSLAADGRIDVTRGTEISGEVHTIELHEPRGTDLTGGIGAGSPAEPTELSRTGFSGELAHTVNRVSLSLGGSLEKIDYKDTPRVLPAVPATFNNDDRDRTATELFAKASIEATDDTAVFIRGRWTEHDFDAAVDDDGYNRDSSGWGIDGGLDFSMTHLLVGELFAGYTSRNYDDSRFGDTGELAFGAGLKWFPTMLTTVSLDGARTIEDTSIMAASGYVSTRGQLGVDHELLRNVILSARLGYENAEYQDAARSDDTLSASLSGRILINNNLHCDASWQYADRNSSDPQFDYATSQFTLSLTAKF